jgi:hypothetical protein
MRRSALLAAIVGFASVVAGAQDARPAQLLTADQIMAKVAANQDRSEQLRKRYVYRQHIRVVLNKSNGKLMREETTDDHMVPQSDKTERKLEIITGKYWEKGKYTEFSGEPVPHAEGVDAELLKDMRDDLTEEKSKDGLGRRQYPFISEELPKYIFKLVGKETFRGRDSYRISFGPVNKSEYDWKGEAYIDAADFEPIYIYTKLPRKLPLAVRTLLGTDVPGYGYSLTYEKQPGGVWFPKSYGTEFTLHVLYFYNREVMVSMENKDFEQTHVETKITAEATQ